MDLTHYLLAGYGMLFIETNEIKRAIRSIKANGFDLVYWNINRGIIVNEVNYNEDQECDQLSIIEAAISKPRTVFILERYDQFLDNNLITQMLLDAYKLLKANQTCMVIVGTDSKQIPIDIKEFIPVLDFELPCRDEIVTIATGIQEAVIESANDMLNSGKWTKEEFDASNYSVTSEITDACQGMSYEEIENVLAYSAVKHRKFDLMTILERKRYIIRQTGFMDFFQPEPIESLGGLEEFKNYWKKRIEPFKNPDSVKPKVRSVLLVGFQGTGKSLAVKCLSSLLEWPGIVLDVGGLKGGIVGETEAKTRRATKIIDGFGKAVICIDEIEKAFGGTGRGMAHETSEGILGHFLTWMQERKSDAVIVATANNLDILPPEFLRLGRWDTIFFVDLPNPTEVKQIINIKNKQFKSELPNDDQFCENLWKEKWSGAEIEQLAKDSHYENSIMAALQQIPVLAQYREKELQSIKEKAKIYRHANTSYIPKKSKSLKVKGKRAMTLQ
jgi:SpoVK/Ycf46/Vps4 family AAA+-type ATPase